MAALDLDMPESWEVPPYDIVFWRGAKKDFCVVIPVLNEGDRIMSLLERMSSLEIPSLVDIVIVDGGSTDESIDATAFRRLGVAGALVKLGVGGLSAQLRCGYAFCLLNDYQGVITIDGNDKDDPSAIPRFISALRSGFDFVQGSRFIEGGSAINTPKYRDLAIRLIHAPLLSLASGFKWTDSTQGFRAYSARLLLSEDIQPFRNIFNSYELLAYMSYAAPRQRYRCVEVPTTRRYPLGKVPTKITGVFGNLKVFSILIKTSRGCYSVKARD